MTNPRDDLMALAPCPFCHGAAYLHEQEGQRPEDTRYSVHCDECDTTHDAPSKDAAVAAWNRRTAASRPAPVDREAVAKAIESNLTRGTRVDVDFVRNVTDTILSLLRPAEPVEAEGVGEPVAWPNGCNETIPKALRFLAKYERPASGHQDFNSEHLYQLADEIEQMASRPLYTHPPKSPDTNAAVLAMRDACELIATTEKNQRIREINEASGPNARGMISAQAFTASKIAAAIRQLPTPERGE